MVKSHIRTEWIVTFLAFLTWGITMLCRTGFGYFIEEMALSTTQAGLANAVTSISIFLSATIISRYAQKKNRVVETLVIELTVIVLAAAILSLAKTFFGILISKLLLGIGCGPIFTLIMTITEENSEADTYPVNAGIVANGEAILNTICGPILLVALMNLFGYRVANACVAVVIVGVLILWKSFSGIIEKQDRKTQTVVKKTSIIEIIKKKNLVQSIIGGIVTLIPSWCIYVFAPMLLEKEGHYANTTVSLIMSLMGVGMAIWMVIIPKTYGKIGRKATIIGFSLCGAIALFAISLRPDTFIAVLLFALFGGSISALSMIYMAVLPIEEIEEEEKVSAIAIVNGSGELIGASLGPLIVGYVADLLGMKTGMMLAAISMIVSTIVGTTISKNRKGEKNNVKC